MQLIKRVFYKFQRVVVISRINKKNLFRWRNSFKIMTILITLISCLSRTNAQSIFKFTESPGKQIKLKTIMFNSNSYISLSELSLVLPGDNAEISSGIIRTSECVLKSANGSIFVLFNYISVPDSQKVLQLQTPAISIREEIYIPAASFFSSLNNAGLIKYSVKNSEGVIRSARMKSEQKPELTNSFTEKIINLKPLNSQNKQSNIIRIDKGLVYDTTGVKSPNKYVVPKGLIRKELEEKKKK